LKTRRKTIKDKTDRIHGALLGLAAGDALGATVEFATAERIKNTYGVHRDIIGGGAFNWRPGQGTDDTDLAIALARVYADGYSLEAVADAFLAWANGDPKDIGGTTHAALTHYRKHGNPHTSGKAVITKNSAGNGSLMRALATGLFVDDSAVRARQAAEISAITHADKRCIDACVIYADIAHYLVKGARPADAIRLASVSVPANSPALSVLSWAPLDELHELDPGGYVLASLGVAVWAISQTNSFEDILIDIVNLGDDADTTGAIAGGLLGAHRGIQAIPLRWLNKLEYRDEIKDLVARLT
jgi:ADP-ribosyl-[dinitrogen reductase] hydrolase